MRTISTADDKVLTATGGRATFYRVKVKDSGGTFRDLTTYPGQNLCLSVDWGEDVDSPGLDANIYLKREVEKLSLAPLVGLSPLNRAFAYPGSYAPLIAVAREVQIDVAVVPDGITPSSGDWNLQFHGYIDMVDAAADSHLVLKCSDLQAKLRDTWIERERAYAFAQGANATKGCIYWRAGDTLAVGERGVPTEARKNGHFYRVTSITTGITGSTEPSWPTGGGSTVVDGGVTWTESGSTSSTATTSIETVIQQILDDNLGAGVVTLNCPVSPSFGFVKWKQDRMSVWDALRALVDQTAWDFRYKWDGASSSFKLTLYDPNRAKVTPDRTIGPTQRYGLKKLSTDVSWIRNAVQIVWSDPADLDPAKHPKRKTAVRTDSASITAYGRRFCEVAEGGTIYIRTSTQANAFGDGILSDLANPVADQQCEVPLFRHVELTDLLRWSADELHYDTDQDLAVTKYRHSIGEKEARTSIDTRGKPSAGRDRWHDLIAIDQHSLDLDNTESLTIATSDIVGGAKINLSGTGNKMSLPLESEVHVSPTPSFTPDSTTLVAEGSKSEISLPDLVAGKTYYMQVIPKGHNRSRIVRSLPSVEQSFVAGRASSGHIHGGIALGDYPLNGGFETRLDPAGMPDHWTVASGAYSSDVEVMEDNNGFSGKRYIRIKNTSGGVLSAIFPILNEAYESTRYERPYRVTWWRKAGSSNSAGATYKVYIRLLSYTDGEIVILTGIIGNKPADDKKGHWVQEEAVIKLAGGSNSSTRSLQLMFLGNSGATCQVDFDDCRIQPIGTPWYDVGDTSNFTDNYEAIPGFANSWVNYGGGTYNDCSFRKNHRGRVFLKGITKNGTVGAGIFTLPVAYRPPRSYYFAVESNNAFGIVEVLASGAVVCQVGNNAHVSLDGISFETF